MRNQLPFSLLSILILLLSACGPGSGFTTGDDGTLVWLDQPMTNYSLPVAPFTLIAHAGHPGAGITQVVFLVNGISVGAVSTDTSAEFLRAEMVWNPSGPGRYLVQARAITAGGSAYTRNAFLCVRADITAPQAGSAGACAPTAPVPFSVAINLLSNPVYHGACSGTTLALEAVLTGDSSAVAALQAGWSYMNQDGSSPAGANGEGNLPMTLVSGSTYSWQRDFASIGSMGTATYLLYASVRGVDSSGNVLAQQNVGPVDWLPCPTTGKENLPSVTPTETPTSTPSATAAPVTPTRTPFIPSVTSAPADTTPPSISGITVNPADNAYYTSGCGPNTVSVSAFVSDASGVGSVTLQYQYAGGATYSIGMADAGGGNYTATINVGAEGYGALSGLSGALTVGIQATDLAKNSTYIPWGGSVLIQYCPG
jgi:hypothetical protein